MDAENDNFFEQSNLSSASSSNNSSNSNLLINLPMLPILHAHDGDDDDDDDDNDIDNGAIVDVDIGEQTQSQLPATLATSIGETTGTAVAATAAVRANNNDTINNTTHITSTTSSTSNSNTNTNNTDTTIVDLQFDASSFSFNNHASPSLSSPSSASSASPPPLVAQQLSISLLSSLPSTSSSSHINTQNNQSSMQTEQSADIGTGNNSQANLNINPNPNTSTTTITNINTTTATTIIFANESTEHQHQQHSPNPPFHQQHESLQSTVHDQQEQNENVVVARQEQAALSPTAAAVAGASVGGIIDAANIADTIDVSAIETAPSSSTVATTTAAAAAASTSEAATASQANELVRIDDDADAEEAGDDNDVEIVEEENSNTEEIAADEVFAPSSSRRHRRRPSPLRLAASTSALHATVTPPTTSLPLLQAAPKHPNYASAASSGFSASQPSLWTHHSLLNREQQTQLATQLPSSSSTLDSIFNFGNGQPINNMYSGHGDAPHSSGAGGGSSGSSTSGQHPVVDRLKMLYPNVNENETPLPRCWSPHDKCLSIGLSQNNLRVHYKGSGKQHNDAASVRTAHPIPPSCGLYYFEVKIISKGKNGYMGIGLTAQQFRMNRLPGWDKQSYGYHGDDGNSFSSSGNGQTYGPTFTTGDIIGCCVNFVDNTCFYTKNGLNLGVAFKELPSKLYPTVGLQTPGEEVDANFGQEPFKFSIIEDMMKKKREEIKANIYDFPMLQDNGDPTMLLHKMVSSYLVHNGYSQTADAFSRSTGQTFDEDISSIRNRQKIIKLAMSGKMGQAIEQTLNSYPGLLENNKNLWFMLKCRQFIEMINGSDIEQYCPSSHNIKSTNSTTTQTNTPPNQTSVIQSTKLYQANGKQEQQTQQQTNEQQTVANSTAVINSDNQQQQQELKHTPIIVDNDAIGDCNTNTNSKSIDIESTNIDYQNDVEMENNGHSNGNVCKNGNANNFTSTLDMDEEMADVDATLSTRKYSQVIERILEFGKELSLMGQQLEKDNKMTDEERQMLEDAFSLIAYSNPWSSPLGWQLCPTRRENVCTALNSAILESLNYARRPPLDVCVAHAAELLKVMAQASLGACAFVNIEDIFPQN